MKAVPGLLLPLPFSPFVVSHPGLGLEEVQDWRNRGGGNSNPKVLHLLLLYPQVFPASCSFGEELGVVDVFYQVFSERPAEVF